MNMKTILTILLLSFPIFAKKTPMWSNYNETVWSDSGKVFIEIHVTHKDLDEGMNLTETRFREVITSHFCEAGTNVPCIYYNFTRVGSRWEFLNLGEDYKYYDIYRTFSIQDVYSNR